MLKDRQTTARTMPRLERTETEIKSFCDRKRNVSMTRVRSAGGSPPVAPGRAKGRRQEGVKGADRLRAELPVEPRLRPEDGPTRPGLAAAGSKEQGARPRGRMSCLEAVTG